MRVILLSLVFLGPVLSPAEEVEVQIVEDADCRLGKDVRRIEVLTERAGCTAHYAKFGQNQQIASARSGVDVCLAALTKTKRNLESAGFKCE